ncbi:MAG TPA: hypothetical protein VEB21_04045 [Terriglobales bacterium]|nr:hypothetical protein [Terriglobales bacterium]
MSSLPQVKIDQADTPPVLQDGGLPLMKVGDGYAPEGPKDLNHAGVDPQILIDLTLKLALMLTKFTIADASHRLCLPPSIVNEILEQHRKDKFIEILGENGKYDYRYTITGFGQERAQRLMDMSGYVGPAPVAVESYRQALDWQLLKFPTISPTRVTDAVKDLVLSDQTVRGAGLAAASARSLFIWGPPGTGKTTIGHLLHNALDGDLWIPHCLALDTNMIRVFDPQCHQVRTDPLPSAEARKVDRRWVRIRRPFIVAGGELTVDQLELSYSPARRYYEAPLHMKANGGIFLLDDLGYQRSDPRTLLSRWIFPLERGVDFLTLQSGQKMQVPFKLMLIISTNMDPDKLIDQAFLRRMGYRLFVGNPAEPEYREIFRRLATKNGLELGEELLDWLVARYGREDRPLRACDPRDLIERVRDLARYERCSFELTRDTLDTAWRGFFGERSTHREGDLQ